MQALREAGAPEIVVVVGGVIPQQDYEFLERSGVAAVFGPGTVISVAAQAVLNAIRELRVPTGAGLI